MTYRTYVPSSTTGRTTVAGPRGTREADPSARRISVAWLNECRSMLREAVEDPRRGAATPSTPTR